MVYSAKNYTHRQNLCMWNSLEKFQWNTIKVKFIWKNFMNFTQNVVFKWVSDEIPVTAMYKYTCISFPRGDNNEIVNDQILKFSHPEPLGQ